MDYKIFHRLTKEEIMEQTTEGIPVWRADDGIIISGLKKHHFFENVSAEDKKLALNEYYQYKAAKKELLAEALETKALEARDCKNEFLNKAEACLREPTAEEKRLILIKKLEAKLEKVKLA